MKPSVLFIFTPFIGHLNKTTLLARHYAQKGAEITYLINSESTSFKPDFPCNVIFTKFGPDGSTSSAQSDELNKTFNETNTHSDFLDRRKILLNVIDQSKATLVFVDCFCANDYLLVYEKLKSIRTIFIEPWLPNLPGEYVPPMHSKSIPNYFANAGWLWQRIRVYTKLLHKHYIHNEVNVVWLLNKLVDEMKQIPRLKFYANKYPVYPEVEWWYMYPKELDYFERSLPKGCRYMGPAIDTRRKQQMPSAVEIFLKLVTLSLSKTLIYCTFGTVIRTFHSAETILSFYEKLNRIAFTHPEWNILVSVSPDILNRIRPSGLNILFACDLPQLEILKQATVCINHGGGGTVLECAVAGVPMLCIPAADKVDYNGNSTRVEYHKIGLSTNFNSSDSEIESLLNQLTLNPVYKINANRMSRIINSTYGPGYLDSMDLPQL